MLRGLGLGLRAGLGLVDKGLVRGYLGLGLVRVRVNSDPVLLCYSRTSLVGFRLVGYRLMGYGLVGYGEMGCG